MPDAVVRAPEIPGNRKRDTVPSREPSGTLLGPASVSGAPEEVPTLATPTLAALYAAQGHREMAAAIYAQLRLGGRDSSSGPSLEKDPGPAGPAGEAPGALVERLLALHRAARRRRAQVQSAPVPPEGEEGADGR